MGEVASATDGEKVAVYVESGPRLTVASAADWPGWSRSGRGEEAALEMLADYAPRYARVLEQGGLPFNSVAGVGSFAVAERLPGSASTDLGVPSPAAGDGRPLEEAERRWCERVLSACWAAFDEAARAAEGRELRKGPRGGGRELEAIRRHVLEAERAYLGQVGWKLGAAGEANAGDEAQLVRRAVIDGLGASARGELPTRGPRGGARWPARYFVRRVAWHVLDHAWEIEDRNQGG